MVCINKFDINLENSGQIVSYCEKNDSKIVGKIPYESKVVEALVNRKSVMNYPCNEVRGIVQRMWDQVEAVLIQ
jgi:MinD superfamily P-loop ATPase